MAFLNYEEAVERLNNICLSKLQYFKSELNKLNSKIAYTKKAIEFYNNITIK